MKKGYRIVSSKLIHGNDEVSINVKECEIVRKLNHPLLTHADAWVLGIDKICWIHDRFCDESRLKLEITLTDRTIMIFENVSIFLYRTVMGVESKVQFTMVGSDFYTKKREWRIA